MFILFKFSALSFAFSLVFFSGARANYPPEWWQPIPRKEAKSWEILPQEAGPGEVILSKRTELGVFSNFARTPFVFAGEPYESVEGFWQMLKYPEGLEDPRALHPGLVWPYERAEVAKMVGYEAKTAGDRANYNMQLMGIQWVTYAGERIEYKGRHQKRHLELITSVMKAKVAQNLEVKSLLLQTKGLILRPDHIQREDAPPAYKYYDILMKIRDTY